MKSLRAFGALVAVVAIVAGCAGDGSSAEASDGDIVEVSMTEMEFTPARFTANVGETITFRFTNDGVVRHEAVIGTAEDQGDHATEMDSDPHDAHDDGAVSAISLAPGETGDLTHLFAEPGEYLIGCHEPGHYEGGMRATVIVS